MKKQFQLQDENMGFWGRRMRLVIGQVIPMQYKILQDQLPDTEPSRAIENFRIAAGLSTGEHHGMIFQDSDVGKWIEAAAYSLQVKPDTELERRIDEVVDIIGQAQQPDSYLNTYFTIKEPSKRWTNLLECHELYTAGHLTEGAVAYFEATGKRKFMEIMCRMADHIDTVIGPEDGKLHGYPGHPEIELALVRLYRATREPRYLRLAQYFVDQRGQKPYFFDEERRKKGFSAYFDGMYELGREYAQWHVPVREQTEATGHAVRALYLYAAMAEIAAEENDAELYQVCRRLWDSAVRRRMYITGGFGATQHGEAFSEDYELPNDTAYAETCASVAFMFFSKAMLRIDRDGAVADEMERALYNGTISGMQLDGKRFFYVNPLETAQGISGKAAGYRHVKPVRQKWFGCACCPPNLARLVASLPDYTYDAGEADISIHQYISGVCSMPTAGGVSITHQSNYPWDGELFWIVEPAVADAKFSLHIRIPGWCKTAELLVDGRPYPLDGQVHKGYVTLTRAWGASTEVRLLLTLEVRRQYAHLNVRQNAGCVALMRGPVVYCFESEDNGKPLSALRISRDANVFVSRYNDALLGGIRTLQVNGLALAQQNELYTDTPPAATPKMLTAIPYFAWANRSAGDMRVWMLEQ